MLKLGHNDDTFWIYILYREDQDFFDIAFTVLALVNFSCRCKSIFLIQVN